MHKSLPVLALLCNALIWGVSWWPLRRMYEAGLHPLWAIAAMFALITLTLLLLRPGALRRLLRTPGLWLLVLVAGLTNVGFNWAVTIGDVVRVVILFYLMPAWSILLAWRFLGEPPTRSALARLVLAFAGVLLVLWPADGKLAHFTRGFSLADALALLGGFMFAATNVALRRLRDEPTPARVLAMFAGGALLGGLAAAAGQSLGAVPALPGADAAWLVPLLLWAGALMLANWALQYGATRLPAGTTALVMLCEVLFASASSVAAGAAQPTLRTWAGGALIISASLLAALQARR
ncbi:DMT family transporter [Comamonas sp. NLF-1-9]|uniref:DMT family transporter n=1 Tax=Comamonas sp. NLF-1-9 TaxID=2853163 RepID=UPI001C4616E2|nr:DMT family transporter [Comamonas sp. NLF-1-9]QXL83783.1 DMT family transporter [Comamonas sp. NLF-1-9]